MGNRQDQSVGDNSSAIQNFGTINNSGMSAGQMAEIMESIFRLFSQFTDQAEKIAKQRFYEFREEMVSEFTKADSKANPNAFGDPDFQFVLKETQEVFCRKGGDTLKGDLVKLLADRSNAVSGTRKANVLNDAINVAGKLSEDEISALCVIFLLKDVILMNGDYREIMQEYRTYLSVFSPKLVMSSGVCAYLESLRCVYTDFSTRASLYEVATDYFSGIYVHGYDEGFNYGGRVSDEGMSKISHGIHYFTSNGVKKWRFKFGTVSAFVNFIMNCGLSDEERDVVVSHYHKNKIDHPDKYNFLCGGIVGVDNLINVWHEELRYRNMTLLGRVLAHSALVSRANFPHPMEVWVN